MKFDFCIGNPPYQDESVGENESFTPQVYDKFMEESYKISNASILIHPGRFLFNAGSTSKAWNEKMLSDEHFKILHYESDTRKVFPNTAITGGVAISYHDENNTYTPIGVFTPFTELNTILRKTTEKEGFESIEGIVITRTVYRLTEKMHEDHPEAMGQLSKGHAYDMSSNIFERLPQIFYEKKPNDGYEYILMLGRKEGKRTNMFLRRDYANNVANLDKFKIVLAKADGAAGTIGNPIPARVMGTPIVQAPGMGTTESFITIGAFESEDIAENAEKYVKSKFARALLSVLKVTQEITPGKWKYVPIQDFSSQSDIDWSKSIHEIDQQLYKKYGLSQEEIDFIETNVKEME